MPNQGMSVFSEHYSVTCHTSKGRTMSNLVRTIHSHSRGIDIKASIYSVPGGYKSVVVVNDTAQGPTYGLVYEDFVESVAQYVIDLSFTLDEESEMYSSARSLSFSFKSTRVAA